MSDFRYLVVGRGMMGAAAAKYLAGASEGVGLIGPGEPVDKRHHEGVFASHYDEGRITRTIDPDPVWARLANRSIQRYRDIERESGVAFFSEVGCLATGVARSAGGTYLTDVLAAAEALGAAVETLDDQTLEARFPHFSIEAGSEGVFEAKGAGHISPRRLVAAQSRLAERNGTRLIDDVVARIVPGENSVTVETMSGQTYTADRVLAATGGFSIAEGLLPQRPVLAVNARTIVFLEVDEADAQRLTAMPSLITYPSDSGDSIYFLPPIRYPDGRYYMKIGGDPDDLRLSGLAELQDWFRGQGRDSAKSHLVRIATELLTGIAVRSTSTGACVTTFTQTDLPAIGFTASPRLALATGGCGRAAKSSDEIGRLGAETLLTGEIADPAYAGVDFSPRFA